jgi:long-chain acyl-CoA synthetase
MEQYNGISVYYAENMAKIIDNIQELKVDMMSTVPRLLERVFDKIMAKGDALT